jgi:adenylate cyclase
MTSLEPTPPAAPHTPAATSDTAEEWRWGSGTEAPGALPADAGPRTVVRTFAFLDLCGSTAFLEEQGARATTEVVAGFRALVRDVAARRGVRVAKWMGDGVMLVGVASGPVLAAAVELTASMRNSQLQARAGVAVSSALVFDGDDYLARGANFAARICDAAEPSEVLCDKDVAPAIPEWVETTATRDVVVRGMGSHEVLSLAAKAGTV